MQQLNKNTFLFKDMPCNNLYVILISITSLLLGAYRYVYKSWQYPFVGNAKFWFSNNKY
jgi:hypothetical protein